MAELKVSAPRDERQQPLGWNMGRMERQPEDALLGRRLTCSQLAPSSNQNNNNNHVHCHGHALEDPSKVAGLPGRDGLENYMNHDANAIKSSAEEATAEPKAYETFLLIS